MVTPLKKHHGQHGGLLALGLLAAASVVVWSTHPREPAPPAQSDPGEHRADPAAAVVQPALAIRGEPIEAERASVTAQAPRSHATVTGVLALDERRTTRLHAPVHGWLQKTRESSLGRRVRQGETLAVIYSAEVYLATAELVDQVKTFRGQELLDAKRERLLRWGMPRAMLVQIERTQRPQAMLPLVARGPGIVIAEQGARGQLVEPSGFELFTITDPAFGWVYVDVDQADASRVRVGSKVTLKVDGTARRLPATVAYVYRRVEDGMRKIRLDVYSPRAHVEPGARVTATLALTRAD